MSIATENALAGEDPSQVEIGGVGDPSNLGFCREFSANVGETVTFSCHGGGTVLDIYRIGYYGGSGWRKVATVANTATTQPAPVVVPNTNGGIQCSSWSVTAQWAVPANATSGLYIGVYRNAAMNNASYIPFVVRDDAQEADIIVKTSDTTWGLAYNTYNTPADPIPGKSIYGDNGTMLNPGNRAHFGSYHRPIVTRQNVPQTYWLNSEAPMIRFLERNGFNVKYISSKDLDANPSLLEKGKIFLSSGHDEYWSDNMREAVEAHRDAGRHAIFMTGNEVFWRVRFNEDRSGMYCYKDTMNGPGAHVGGTPLDPVSWTGTWKDTRWANRKPENTLTGTDFRMNGMNHKTPTFTSGSPFVGHPVWRNVNFSNPVSFPDAVGFEADSMLPVLQAPYSVVLAAQTFNIDGAYANDNGQDYTGNGNLNWGIISQRYPSGGTVVGFGTVQWAWGLDTVHDRGDNVEPSIAAQQFTMNLLTDLGADAVTPMSGVVKSAPASLNAYGTGPANTPTSQIMDKLGRRFRTYCLVNDQLVEVYF